MRFDELTVSDAFNLVAMNRPTWFAENQDFYDGEHWQKGDGFKDVKLTPSHWAEPTVSAGIMSIFVSQNFIAECVDRRTDAILSQMPRIEIKVPEDASDEEKDEARRKKQILKHWFQRKHVRSHLKEFASNISLHGKSYLRLRIPAGRLNDGQITGDTPEEVLDNIFVENYQRDSATVIEDPYSGYKVGMIVFEKPQNDLPVWKDEGFDTRSAEISFVKEDGSTLMRVGTDYEDGWEEAVMNIAGNLTIYEGSHDRYITTQVKDAQKGINTTLTLMMFANRESNFQQRVYLNAQPPGTEVIDPVTGEPKFVATDLDRGPDKDIFLAGLIEHQEDGTIRMMQPEMRVVEPGTAERFIKTISELRLGIYRQCRQLHMELTDDATSTGEARMQAAADHEQDVNEFKLAIEQAGHWLLETAWAMAMHFTGTPVSSEAHDDHHVEFECLVDLGTIAATRRAMAVQEVQVGIKSKATARAEIGVLDPDMEKMLVKSEQDEDIEGKVKKAEIIMQLVSAGFDDVKTLLEFVDIDTKLTGDIEEEDEPVPPALAGQPMPVNGNPLQVNSNPPPQ